VSLELKNEHPLTVSANDVHLKFKSEVVSAPGGEVLTRCFDCGTCSGICPVSKTNPAFDPRKILHMIKLGLKERVLRSRALWYCSHCDSCMFVCPQDVRFSSVVDVLREMAVSEGYFDPESFEKWGTGPCKAACPAHISIQGFVGAIVEGRYEEGLKLIKEEMPFPGICGRICPHPCEFQCNRGTIDEPIDIKSLKRFLADKDILSDTPYIPPKKHHKGKRVAVVGSGPAGLTVAYYLAIEGYSVTVLEKHPVAGGMMAVGIPEFRLPRNILRAEIEIIKKLGVKIKLNCEVGTDYTLIDLKKEYDAVFIGIGCARALNLGMPGEDELRGIVDGLTFLRDINLGNPAKPRRKMVVIGGGNTAIDCARTAKRLGYNNVAILYRRTREEMPANSWEVDEAMEEEIDIQFLTAPIKIVAENGKVSGVACVRMKLGDPDESGRRRPIPIDGSEFEVKTNLVVSAIGQAPDLGCLSKEPGINTSQKGLVIADPLTGTTSIVGIFAGGDVVSGPRTVVEAVSSGKRAAIAIDRYLTGGNISSRQERDWKGIRLECEGAEMKERESMPLLSLSERKRTFKEIELGFGEEKARKEADRCLRICGIQKLP